MQNYQKNMYKLATRLWPLNRSLAGKPTYDTLKILKENIKKLKIKKIRSGKKVYDWKIPYEWKVNSAKIIAMVGVSSIKKEDPANLKRRPSIIVMKYLS